MDHSLVINSNWAKRWNSCKLSISLSQIICYVGYEAALMQALFFNVLGAIFSSRRLPPFEFLAKILEFFSVFLEFFQVSLRFFLQIWLILKKSSICMLFLNFFLPAALLSNQMGFWKSKNISTFICHLWL